jgi:hypothetical protein
MKEDLAERYLAARRACEQAGRDKARAECQLEAVLARLKEEFGCNTVGEAEYLLAKMQEEEARLEKKLEKGLAAFEERWEGRL